jgi:putative acetyltransferase
VLNPKAIIRAERPADALAIRRLYEAAFGRSEEADIALALRDAKAITCSLVATTIDDGHVVGHILFSPVSVDSRHQRFSAVGLAPMAVQPEYQRCGIGGALIDAGLEALRTARHQAVVVLGHPSYYPRFGFRDAREFGLAWEQPGHEDAFMALELNPGALRNVSGVVRYRPEVMGYRVRLAQPSELVSIQRIEISAAARFRQSSHPHAADLPPLTMESLIRLREDDGLWVVQAPSGLVAFVALEPLERDLYVVELDVVPEHAGARLGAALLDHAALLAHERGLSRLVLRTFADVPWNAPYYRRLGFSELDVVPPHLSAILRQELDVGLDLQRRVTLARRLSGGQDLPL